MLQLHPIRINLGTNSYTYGSVRLALPQRAFPLPAIPGPTATFKRKGRVVNPWCDVTWQRLTDSGGSGRERKKNKPSSGNLIRYILTIIFYSLLSSPCFILPFGCSTLLLLRLAGNVSGHSVIGLAKSDGLIVSEFYGVVYYTDVDDASKNVDVTVVCRIFYIKITRW